MIYLLLLSLVIIFLFVILYFYIKKWGHDYAIYSRLFISICVISITIAIIIYPEESYNSALEGLHTWFSIVLPSLLPFFIGSELMIKLGIVTFIGTIFEPVMRPIFNVPGCGSFPFMMSITSGYPVGSKIVANLYKEKQCSKAEAQRLLSFCSTSGPLFMIGAVGVGMLNSKLCGTIIALSHYLGSITVGILFRFYKFNEKRPYKSSKNNFKYAFSTLISSYEHETRTLGDLLSDSVKNSINSLLAIGGFIIIFSVIIRILSLSGLINILARILSIIFSPFHIDTKVLNPIACGIFEITTGSKLVSYTSSQLSQKILAIAGLIAWGGFSIHAQVVSMLSNTDLNIKTYILSKMMHSIISCIYAKIIISLCFKPEILDALATFSYSPPINKMNLGWASILTISLEKFTISILVLLCISLTAKIISCSISLFRH